MFIIMYSAQIGVQITAVGQVGCSLERSIVAL